jgi:RsiW-degrading membrane proteinase PrsW (M82 family)
VKKAGIRQVAATIFFALIAIGKKNTWHKDGATVTLFQVVVGALIGFVVVLAILIAIVTFVTR